METKKKYEYDPLLDSRPIIPLIILGLFVSGLSVLGLRIAETIFITDKVGGILAGFIMTVLLLFGLALFFSGIRWPKFFRIVCY